MVEQTNERLVVSSIDGRSIGFMRDVLVEETHIPQLCLVATLAERIGQTAGNARYLTASWNACHDAKLSVEALEAGAVLDLVDLARELLWNFPDLPELLPNSSNARSLIADARAVLAKIDHKGE